MNPLIGTKPRLGASPMGNIGQIISMLKSGNPEQIAMNLMQRNPQFKSFVEQNKGKTAEQIASENGIDLSMIQNLLNGL